VTGKQNLVWFRCFFNFLKHGECGFPNPYSQTPNGSAVSKNFFRGASYFASSTC
jgi:hypothetical protein